MEYVNPTSIAQMAQVPKDTSLPGTGYGLMQGWREGEAMAKAKDFLSLSQAAQAQDYAKQQFDMQSKWEDRPQTLQQNAANLEQTQLGNQKTKWDISQAHQAAKRDNVMGQLRVVGAFSPQLREAKTPMERMALYENMRRQIERQGFQLDPDLSYDPNNPESWNNVLKYASAADELTVYDRKFGQEQRLQTSKQDWASKEGAADRAAKMTMNREDNETRLLMQREEQELKKHLANQGADGFAAVKGWYMREWDRIEAIPPEKRTPQDKARALVAERVLSGQTYNMAPARVGERAGEVVRSELEALGGSKGNRNKPSVTTSPEGVVINPLPDSNDIPSESIEDLVNKYLK